MHLYIGYAMSRKMKNSRMPSRLVVSGQCSSSGSGRSESEAEAESETAPRLKIARRSLPVWNLAEVLDLHEGM